MAQKLNIDIVARDKSKQALGNVQKGLARVKNSVFNLRNAFIGLGAGLVLRGIINAGMQIEELGVQLEALFGSAKKGKQALDAVTKFAKTTPFELSNIQQGVTALATVSEKAESLGISFEELLKITGNTAVQLGGDFALASQQIQRSFSAGIGSADLFRDRAVTAMAGFSAGVKVSVDESILGLAKAFGTGGKFGELTNKLAQTLKGTISNLKDAFFTIQTEIASGFFDELKNQLGDLKKFTETNDQAIRRFSKQMGENLAKGMLKVVNIGKDLVPLLQNIGKIIKSITDGFMALPPFIQQSGIIGAFLFGKKGLVALAGVSLFVDKVKDLIAESKIRMGIFDLENIDSVDAKIKSITQQIDELENNKISLNFEDEGIETKGIDKKINKLLKELEILEEHRKTLQNLNKVQLESNHHMFEMSNGAIKVAESMKEVTKFTSLSNHHMFEMANSVEKSKGALEGFKEGLTSSFDVTIFDRFKEAGETSMNSLKNTLTDFVVTGKMNFQSLKEAIIRSLVEALIGSAVQSAIKKSSALFKMEAIKKAMISVYEGALKTFASIPFPFNIAATGLAIGAGMKLVDKIKGFQKGGAVSKGQPIMVGENGPEMFVPNQTGQIEQSARGTGGGAVNVNFNINTVDASGFEELLFRSRGTITQLINSAVNERGREALI